LTDRKVTLTEELTCGEKKSTRAYQGLIKGLSRAYQGLIKGLSRAYQVASTFDGYANISLASVEQMFQMKLAGAWT